MQLGENPWFWFCIGTLAVWRITHLLVAEDGPWDVLFRLRRWVGSSRLGTLLLCFYCLSIWISVPAAWLIGHNWPERIFLWLALSAASILVECIHNRLVVLVRDEPPDKKE